MTPLVSLGPMIATSADDTSVPSGIGVTQASEGSHAGVVAIPSRACRQRRTAATRPPTRV